MPKKVDTYNPSYPLIEGNPFTDYHADKEFLFQMEKHFPNLFNFEVLSRRGKGIRTDALLRGRFVSDKFSQNTFYVYTFFLYEGGAGRAHDDELRTQLTSGSLWSTNLARYKAATNFRDAIGALNNKECYCIGIYKQDKDCENVLFVGMPAEVLCKSENEKINPTSAFQTYGVNAREAYLKGVFLHEKSFTASKTFNLLLFKPEYFLWYMKNRDELHIGDIDKALEVVKNAPHVITPKYLITKETPQQQIFYGAPGTGKSHRTNQVAALYDTIRTTFHPDSDYSTFVGAYKPTNVENVRYGLNGSSSVAMAYPEDDDEGYHKKGEKIKESKIEYKFVKQAFLKAYINAWKYFSETYRDDTELRPQFLVIEEINRGNCAQIFGDLFQLLDRKNGFSEYPIEADEDIRKSLISHDSLTDPSFGENGLSLTDLQKEAININYMNPGTKGNTIADKICKGKILVLPPNFYIWATMNTSDQSLFPIDSAFKRRWEWTYLKITNAYKKDESTGEYIVDGDGNKISLGWKISVNNQDWWEFLKNINAIINSMTSSADKQLGYFFCKAKNGIISSSTFVGKVAFYLWNDVFKDYAEDNATFLKYKEIGEDGKEVISDLTFPDFYDEDGNVIDNVVSQFIDNVMNWKADNRKNDEE